MSTLHYIYDPLCGWCYGAAPLLKAAREILTVQAHGGGMMTGANRQRVTPQLRAYVKQHDARIAQLTGQPFGPAYADGLLHASDVVLDSEPPTAAILAAETVAGRGLDMLAQLQIAHYVEGRRIAEPATLLEIAAELGLDAQSFAAAFAQQSGAAVRRHIEATRQLMAELGIHGFPGFVLERDGEWQRIEIGNYLGRPQAFQAWLQGQVPGQVGGKPTDGAACRIDGCV